MLEGGGHKAQIQLELQTNIQEVIRQTQSELAGLKTIVSSLKTEITSMIETFKDMNLKGLADTAKNLSKTASAIKSINGTMKTVQTSAKSASENILKLTSKEGSLGKLPAHLNKIANAFERINTLLSSANPKLQTFNNIMTGLMYTANSQKIHNLGAGIRTMGVNSNYAMVQMRRFKTETVLATKRVSELSTASKHIESIGRATTATLPSLFKLKNILGILSGYGLFRLGKSFLDASSDAQEAQNVFDVVYNQNIEGARAMQKQMQETYGLSTKLYGQNVANLGAMMVQLGMDTEIAMKTANDAFISALDIASAYNMELDDAMQKVRAGIAGVSKPLQVVGIDVSVEGMKKFSESMNLSWTDLDRGAQSLLRAYKIQQDIMRSGVAGDFLRTSGQYANSLRQAKELWEEMKVIIGQSIMKSMEQMLNYFKKNKEQALEMARSIGSLIGKMISFIVTLAKFLSENEMVLKSLATIFIAGKAIMMIDATKNALAVADSMILAFGAKAGGVVGLGVAGAVVGTMFLKPLLDDIIMDISAKSQSKRLKEQYPTLFEGLEEKYKTEENPTLKSAIELMQKEWDLTEAGLKELEETASKARQGVLDYTVESNLKTVKELTDTGFLTMDKNAFAKVVEAQDRKQKDELIAKHEENVNETIQLAKEMRLPEQIKGILTGKSYTEQIEAIIAKYEEDLGALVDGLGAEAYNNELVLRLQELIANERKKIAIIEGAKKNQEDQDKAVEEIIKAEEEKVKQSAKRVSNLRKEQNRLADDLYKDMQDITALDLEIAVAEALGDPEKVISAYMAKIEQALSTLKALILEDGIVTDSEYDSYMQLITAKESLIKVQEKYSEQQKTMEENHRKLSDASKKRLDVMQELRKAEDSARAKMMDDMMLQYKINRAKSKGDEEEYYNLRIEQKNREISNLEKSIGTRLQYEGEKTPEGKNLLEQYYKKEQAQIIIDNFSIPKFELPNVNIAIPGEWLSASGGISKMALDVGEIRKLMEKPDEIMKQNQQNKLDKINDLQLKALGEIGYRDAVKQEKEDDSISELNLKIFKEAIGYDIYGKYPVGAEGTENQGKRSGYENLDNTLLMQDVLREQEKISIKKAEYEKNIINSTFEEVLKNAEKSIENIEEVKREQEKNIINSTYNNIFEQEKIATKNVEKQNNVLNSITDNINTSKNTQTESRNIENEKNISNFIFKDMLEGTKTRMENIENILTNNVNKVSVVKEENVSNIASREKELEQIKLKTQENLTNIALQKINEINSNINSTSNVNETSLTSTSTSSQSEDIRVRTQENFVNSVFQEVQRRNETFYNTIKEIITPIIPKISALPVPVETKVKEQEVPNIQQLVQQITLPQQEKKQDTYILSDFNEESKNLGIFEKMLNSILEVFKVQQVAVANDNSLVTNVSQLDIYKKETENLITTTNTLKEDVKTLETKFESVDYQQLFTNVEKSYQEKLVTSLDEYYTSALTTSTEKIMTETVDLVLKINEVEVPEIGNSISERISFEVGELVNGINMLESPTINGEKLFGGLKRDVTKLNGFATEINNTKIPEINLENIYGGIGKTIDNLGSGLLNLQTKSKTLENNINIAKNTFESTYTDVVKPTNTYSENKRLVDNTLNQMKEDETKPLAVATLKVKKTMDDSNKILKSSVDIQNGIVSDYKTASDNLSQLASKPFNLFSKLSDNIIQNSDEVNKKIEENIKAKNLAKTTQIASPVDTTGLVAVGSPMSGEYNFNMDKNGNITATYDTLKNSVDSATSSIANLNGQVQDVTTKVVNNSQALKDTGAELTKAENDLKELEEQAKNTGTAFQKFVKSIQNVGNVISTFGDLFESDFLSDIGHGYSKYTDGIMSLWEMAQQSIKPVAGSMITVDGETRKMEATDLIKQMEGSFSGFINGLDNVDWSEFFRGDFAEGLALTVGSLIGSLVGGSNKGSQIGSGIGGMLGKAIGGLDFITSGISGWVSSSFGSALGSIAGSVVPVLGSVAGSVIGSAIGGLFGGGDTAKKNEERRKRAEELMQKNTDAITSLTDSFIKASDTMANLFDTLVMNLSKIPTVSNITKGKENYDIMLDSFRDVPLQDLSIQAEYKKSRRFRKAKRYYEVYGVSANQVADYMGFGNDISEMSTDALKQFRDQLGSLGDKDFRALLAQNGVKNPRHINGTNLEAFKNQITEYINTIERLEEAQKTFEKDVWMNSFEGINVNDVKKLREEYVALYKDLGLNPNDFGAEIDQMVEANKVLITITQDVRKSFIEAFTDGKNAGEAFVGSLSAVFRALENNIATVVYGTMFDKVNSDLEAFFEDVSNQMSEGKIPDLTQYAKLLANIIKDGQNIEANIGDYFEDLKKQLIDLGVDSGIIEDLFGGVDLDDFTIAIRESLKNGIKEGLANDDISLASKSIGDAIREHVTSALIDSFVQSYILQGQFDSYLKDIDFANMSFDEAFKVMQDTLNKLDDELNIAGIGQATINKTDSTDLSTKVESETQGATITNTYHQYVMNLDGYTSTQTIEQLMNLLEEKGFVKIDKDRV